MIQKSTLESIIKKYHLNGLVEGAKWCVKDKSVFIPFIPTENKALFGHVSYTSMDINDGDISIYNTSNLNKLIRILDHNFTLQVYSERNVPIKLLLSDNQYDLEFYLADPRNIPPVPKIKEPDVYEVSFPIDQEFITKFVKAKKALGDIKQFTVETDLLKNGETIITVGNGDSYANKIKFSIPTTSEYNINPIPYTAELFSEILLANQDSTEGNFYMSKEGLIKLTFKEDQIESTYYLVRLED